MARHANKGRCLMEHQKTIQALIKTLLGSSNFHALLVESPPGWGKSTMVDKALDTLDVKAISFGSYATPLHIYNTLCLYPSSVLILDDSAGVLSDVKTLALLKAATWQSSGQSKSSRTEPGATRRITWGSTSDKIDHPFCDF